MPVNRNNPGNLEFNIANPWQGSNYSDDERFESFEDLQSGYRALGKTLNNYYRLHGLNTTQDIISRFSPPTENDTPALVDNANKRLSEMLGQEVTSETPLNLNDPQIGKALTELLPFRKIVSIHLRNTLTSSRKV